MKTYQISARSDLTTIGGRVPLMISNLLASFLIKLDLVVLGVKYQCIRKDHRFKVESRFKVSNI